MSGFFLLARATALALASGPLLALCAGCSADTDAVSTALEDPPPRTTPVVVVRPEERSVEDAFLDREATLYPISVARISTRQEGFVRRRLVGEGDLLHEGDPIAELDDTDPRLRLTELRASLQRAEATRAEQQRAWKRVERLFAEQVVSEGERDDRLAALDRARAEVAEARARVERAEQTLKELRILAPMDAMVSRRFIEEGEYIERGDPVVELKRIDTIIAICTISERHLHDVQQGAPAVVHVTAFPERTFEGVIWKIIPDAQLESRSFPVWVRLPNPDFTLKPGMSARVSFVRSLEGVVLVPKDAVLEDADGSFVFVVREDRAERRDIELGPAVESAWSVRSGLSADDLVVVTGNEDLAPGGAVQIVELPPPGRPTLPNRLNAAHGDATGS
jgi:RND family efflux transporter MFP subunit